MLSYTLIPSYFFFTKKCLFTLLFPQEYQANFDKETVVTNQLSAPLLVDWIKIRPASWSSCIALRVELYGY